MSIEERITEVLRQHPTLEGCSWCAYDAVKSAPQCCRDAGESNHAEHVAAAVVASLGLTRELSEQYEQGNGWPPRDGMERYVTEWVSS